MIRKITNKDKSLDTQPSPCGYGGHARMSGESDSGDKAHGLLVITPKHIRSIAIAFFALTSTSLSHLKATETKPCTASLKASAPCAPCTFDAWAKKIHTLKERPVQYSTLPHKKAYQKNILMLPHFMETLQQAVDAIAKDSNKDAHWLNKRSVPCQFPEIFQLQRPHKEPIENVENYLFKPWAQRLWLTPGSSVVFFGDIHGSIHSLIRDLEKLKSLGYLDNNFKIVKKNSYIIFLGDYIDRGIYGVEVMYTLARLKIANPHHVIIIRGNHEDYVLAPVFRLSHAKAEEKDMAPSLIDELKYKFDMSVKDSIAIFRFYETLPVVLYLGSGTATHHDYMQCCHGGLEIGYDPYQLLHASPEIRFQLIEKLWRKKHFTSKLSKACQNEIKTAFDLDILCTDIRDISPDAPIWQVPGTDHTSYLGFMWNDFYVDPKKTVGQRGKKFTGWVCGKKLTNDVLSWGNSQTVTLQGVFRAHQHNNETGGPMLNLLCCSKGMARIWDKNVYTFVSAPDSKLDDTGENCFTYDSFVILKTTTTFNRWHMHHYIQDGGMEKPSWKVIPVRTY